MKRAKICLCSQLAPVVFCETITNYAKGGSQTIENLLIVCWQLNRCRALDSGGSRGSSHPPHSHPWRQIAIQSPLEPRSWKQFGVTYFTVLCTWKTPLCFLFRLTTTRGTLLVVNKTITKTIWIGRNNPTLENSKYKADGHLLLLVDKMAPIVSRTCQKERVG